MLPLLAENPPKTFDVIVVELAVPRRRPLRIQQPLALQEPDLGDRDVRELLPQE
jgi:BarA-like signal transduction histidine kinase